MITSSGMKMFTSVPIAEPTIRPISAMISIACCSPSFASRTRRCAPAPDPPLGDRRGVRVVVDPAGDLPALRHAVPEGKIRERDVRRPDRAPGALVDRGRDTEPDGGDALVHQLLNRLVEPREKGFRR